MSSSTDYMSIISSFLINFQMLELLMSRGIEMVRVKGLVFFLMFREKLTFLPANMILAILPGFSLSGLHTVSIFSSLRDLIELDAKFCELIFFFLSALEMISFLS